MNYRAYVNREYYHRPLEKGAVCHPNTGGRYWTRPINLEPQPRYVAIMLLPVRILVAMFMWLTDTISYEVSEDFGYMFRSKTTKQYTNE